MAFILNLDLYVHFSTSEGMCMKLLCKEEVKTVRAFLEIPIPEYICGYRDGQFDLMDCYEVAFTFANDLLRGRKVNPYTSPWGDGKSVIFDPCYEKLLSDIQNSNVGTDINNYCNVFLKVLDVFKSHLV